MPFGVGICLLPGRLPLLPCGDVRRELWKNQPPVRWAGRLGTGPTRQYDGKALSHGPCKKHSPDASRHGRLERTPECEPHS